jgi:hypothetical protein
MLKFVAVVLRSRPDRGNIMEKKIIMTPEIQDYLKQMHDMHGILTPEAVVEDAKHEGSPLHGLFEWNREKAALAHWHDVARRLIRSVRVQITNEGTTLKAPYFVRDPSLPNDQQGYTTINRLRKDADLARDAVADECSRAAAAFRRAQEVAVAVGVEDDIHDLLNRTIDLGARVRQQA